MINNNNTENISRRGFMKSIITIWFSVLSLPFIYAVTKYIEPPAKKFKSKSQTQNNNESNIIPIESVPENSGKIVSIEEEPVLIVRKSGNDISVYSAVCSHLNCLVGYRKNENDIICNCHGSTFTLDGLPTKGPAVKPLKKLASTVADGKITITGLDI
jgi:cytochrome b6-f complex iron-sulfur subunit